RPESRLFRHRRLFVVDLRLGLGGWLRRAGLVYAHNPRSAAAFFVDRDQRAVQANFTSGHRKRRRHVRNKAIHDWFNRPAKNRIHPTAHPGITQKRSPAGEDLFVRRLDMGMRANHGRDFPIKKTSHRDFLARCLTVNIDNDVCSFLPHLGDRFIHRAKWILQNRLHERATLHVDHTDLSLRRLEDDRSASGRPRRIIYRSEQPRLVSINDKISFWSQTWSPVVTTETPARKRSIVILPVMPRPPAAFSPFTTIKSTSCCSFNSGSRAMSALRPGSPTTSPRKRTASILRSSY